MTDISLGLKHYLLILMPSLIDELTDYGFDLAASQPGLQKHDLEKAFFAARAIKHHLPDHPSFAQPELWPEIIRAAHTVGLVLDVLEKETFETVAAEARKTTAEIARADIKRVFEQKRAQGEVDFRLHGLSNMEAVADAPDPAIQESFLIKRVGRYRMFMVFDERVLKADEQVIIRDAKALLRRIMDNELNDQRIDAILALGTVLAEMASVKLNSNVPDVIKEKFERMTRKAAMAIGALVYRDEYQKLKNSLDLPPLDSDV